MRGKKEAWTGDQNGPLIFVNLSIKKKYVRKFQIWVFIESYKHFKVPKFGNSIPIPNKETAQKIHRRHLR